MRQTAVTIGVVCLFSAGVWAMPAQQQGKAPQNGAAQPAQPANAATVRNDRHATMPRVGYSANLNPTQNELVGCLVRQGQSLLLVQPELRRRYELHGSAELGGDAGKMVKVTGRLRLGAEAIFEVQQSQVVQPKCDYAQSTLWRVVTGGAGGEGSAFNVTSTATLGQTTPAIETEAGQKQNPSMAEGVQTFGANPAGRPHYTEAQGAPPNPRIENPAEAQRIADSATQSELSNEKQLGVNAQPNYSTAGNAQQNQQAVANAAQQQRGQAPDSAHVLQGGANLPGNQEGAEMASGTAPVVFGCLTRKDNHLVVVERNSGQPYTVDPAGSNAGEYVGREVRIAGNVTGVYAPAIATADDQATVHVQSIQAQGACSTR